MFLSMVLSAAVLLSPPIKSNIVELAEVNRIQVEVTAWKDQDAGLTCDDIYPDNLEVEIDGKPVKILEIDSISESYGETRQNPSNILIGIDLRFMAPMKCSFCQPCNTRIYYIGSRDRVISWLQDKCETISTDKLAIVTTPRMMSEPINFVPVDYVKPKLSLLSDLLRNRYFQASIPSTKISDDVDSRMFWNEWKEILESVPDTGGRIDMIFIAADIPDLKEREVKELSMLAQRKHIVIYPLYIIHDVGLRNPRGLGVLAEATGGKMFYHHETLKHVIWDVEHSSCRYILNLDAPAKMKKGKLTVRSLTPIKLSAPLYISKGKQ